MADITPATAERLLKWLLTTEKVERPTYLWLALFNGLTNEIFMPGYYMRRPIVFAPDPTQAGRLHNINTVNFTTGYLPFGLVNRVALFETLTGGEPLWAKDISPRYVMANEQLRVEPHAIWIYLQ